MNDKLAMVLIIPPNRDYIIMLHQDGNRFNIPRVGHNYLKVNDIVRIVANNNKVSLKLLTDDTNDVIVFKTFSKQLVPYGYYDHVQDSTDASYDDGGD